MCANASDVVAASPRGCQPHISGNIEVVDGVTNQLFDIYDDNYPAAIALNPLTNNIYVAESNSSITIINGATNKATSITNPNAYSSLAVAVNPVTNKIYFANGYTNNVTVLEGATERAVTIADPNAVNPVAIAVDPVTNKIYVANQGSNNITVVDGATNQITTVADPPAAGK